MAEEPAATQSATVLLTASRRLTLSVIAIVSGPTGDDSAYFRRPSCLSELRWAIETQVFVQPVVAEDKGIITEFFTDIPSDLDHLKGVNWNHIDRKDVDYFELGVTKIIRACSDEQLRSAAHHTAQPEPEPGSTY